MSDFNLWAKMIQQRTELALDHFSVPENVTPTHLHQAMRYALLGGGKRVRALLVYAVGELFSGNAESLDHAAAAVECIHAYSLIHDDLPCMDDDDLRRGKPSCHKAFDEATALLAGDALQSLAFEILSTVNQSADNTLKMVQLLAKSSGSEGMAGGQAIDLASEGLKLSQSALENMHSLKTGALIRASALLGAYSTSQISDSELANIEIYATKLGLAFQVIDDVLDVTADEATLGKTSGKDLAQNKATYVSLLGLNEAKAYARKLHQEAIAAIHTFGERASRLSQLADFICERQY